MGMKTKQVGGGPATGLANDFVGMLQSGLRTGTFGAGGATSQFAHADPAGSTTGISGVLNDILAGGAGQLGGSLQKLIETQQHNDIAGIRSRFGVGGGTAFGTPGQYAESTYRAQAAPQIATAVGGMQQQLLGQLLPLIAGLSSKGIPQAEMVQQESPWLQAAKLGLTGLGSVAGMFAGNPGAGASVGSMFGNLFGGGSGGFGGLVPEVPDMFNFNTMPGVGQMQYWANPTLGMAH